MQLIMHGLGCSVGHDCMAHGMENTDGFEFPRSALGAGGIAGYCLG